MPIFTNKTDGMWDGVVTIRLENTAGGDANVLNISELQANGTFIPEPGTIALGMISFGMVALRRRRR
jgi:hypothetical protein